MDSKTIDLTIIGRPIGAGAVFDATQRRRRATALRSAVNWVEGAVSKPLISRFEDLAIEPAP